MTEKEKADAMTPEERAAYILSIQPPSTRAALSRPVEDDLKWHLRPVPSNYLAVPEAKSLDELVGTRALGFEEVAAYHRLRQSRGRIIGEMRKEAEVSSLGEEKKGRAVAAFMFVKMKFKDLMKSMGLASDKEMARLKDDK